MIIQSVELVVLLGICLYTDLREQKIKNKYSLPMAILGFATNLFVGYVGWKGSLLGLVLPFVIFFPFFFLHMFRAGDIKAMMAIGAIMGYRFIGNAIFYIFAVGLIVALIKMVYYRNAKERFRNVGTYFKLLFQTFQPVPYERANVYDKAAHFPFSIAIASGSIINLIAEYMGFYLFFR